MKHLFSIISILPSLLCLAEVPLLVMEFTPTQKRGLKFTAVEANSSIKFNGGAVTGDYIASTNNSEWFDYTIGDAISLPNTNDCVIFKAKTNNVAFCQNATSSNPGITMTGKIEASGNIQYLLDKSGKRDDVSTNCYYEMFANCTSLTKAPELPAMVISGGCYYGMFAKCTSLTQAPELPATNLIIDCYNSMFFNCTSLTQAPDLPAINLDRRCCYYMFYGCKALTQAPELPATNLAISCYSDMFGYCTALEQAPELPAEILADSCYFDMFQGCSKLLQAPLLPATSLASKCYNNMFYGCKKFTTCRMKSSMRYIYDKTTHGNIQKTVNFDIPD